jgi:hypothetical protein
VSLYESTASVWSVPADVKVYGAGQSGSTLTVTMTAADTLKVGDVISIAGVYPVNPSTKRTTQKATPRQFVVTKAIASATGGAGGDTIDIYPALLGPGETYQNVDALPATGALITLYPGTTTPSTGPVSGINSLAIHRDAFALVGVPLDNPKKEEMVGQSRDPETGLQVSFIRSFDPIERRWINRFDVLFGFGKLYADSHAVRVLGA